MTSCSLFLVWAKESSGTVGNEVGVASEDSLIINSDDLYASTSKC